VAKKMLSLGGQKKKKKWFSFAEKCQSGFQMAITIRKTGQIVWFSNGT
jgi:hypothetical protein